MELGAELWLVGEGGLSGGGGSRAARVPWGDSRPRRSEALCTGGLLWPLSCT